MGQTPPGSAETIASNIRRLIEESGTSGNRLAEAAGISKQSFHRKLGKSPETFSLREVDNIAEALGLTVLDLLVA